MGGKRASADETARAERLKAALRANLRKRKAQRPAGAGDRHDNDRHDNVRHDDNGQTGRDGQDGQDRR